MRMLAFVWLSTVVLAVPAVAQPRVEPYALFGVSAPPAFGAAGGVESRLARPIGATGEAAVLTTGGESTDAFSADLTATWPTTSRGFRPYLAAGYTHFGTFMSSPDNPHAWRVRAGAKRRADGDRMIFEALVFITIDGSQATILPMFRLGLAFR